VKDLRGKSMVADRRNPVEQTALRGSLEVFDLAHPAGQWVPSGENLGHHLQVVDSKRLKSATHFIDRTAWLTIALCSGLSNRRVALAFDIGELHQGVHPQS
jgi:hypothetical protein